MKGYVTYNEVAYRDDDSQVTGERLKTLIVLVVLGVSFLLAFFLYRLGETWLAVGIVSVTLGAMMLIAPQIAFYIYFGWQALDPIFIDPERMLVTPGKVLAVFMVLLYIVSFGRIRRRILVSKGVITLMLAFGFWGLLLAPFTLDRFVAMKNSLQVITQVILVAGTIHFLDSKKRIRYLFFLCFLGGVIAAGKVILFPSVGAQFRATIGRFTNPQTTCFALSTSLMALVGLWAIRPPRKKYVIFYLLGCAVIFFGVLDTGSRAGLISILVALTVQTVFAKGISLGRRMIMPLLLTGIIIGGVVYILGTGTLSTQSQERLKEMVTTGRVESGPGARRIGILKRVLSTYLEHNPFFGWGLGNSSTAMILYRSEKRDIHNSFLGPLCESGPIGFILFNFGVFLLYLRVRSIANTRMCNSATAIYVFLILSSIAHTAQFTRWFWIPVTMCLLLAEESKYEELEEYSEVEFSPEISGDVGDY
jgi:hypothetical protein